MPLGRVVVANNLREVNPGERWETSEIFAEVWPNQIDLVLQQNIQVPGTDVIRHQFRWLAGRPGPQLESLLNALEAQAPGLGSQALASYLRKIAVKNPMYGRSYVRMHGTDGQDVQRSRVPSSRVYSKLGMSRLEPLPAKPAKPTMEHVKRALANGQYRDLRGDSGVIGSPAPDSRVGALDVDEFLWKLVGLQDYAGWYVGFRKDEPYRVIVANGWLECNSFELVI